MKNLLSQMPLCRLAVVADLPVLAQMRWDFRMEDQAAASRHSQAEFLTAYIDFLQEGLATGRWAFWVAEVEGQVVAHMFVQIIPKVPKPNALADRFGYLTNVYTRPAFRNRGIGEVLLAAVQAWALAADLEMLVVWPSQRSSSFYQRAGFEAGESWEYSVRPEID